MESSIEDVISAEGKRAAIPGVEGIENRPSEKNGRLNVHSSPWNAHVGTHPYRKVLSWKEGIEQTGLLSSRVVAAAFVALRWRYR